MKRIFLILSLLSFGAIFADAIDQLQTPLFSDTLETIAKEMATNIYEKGNHVVVEMDIPGIIDVNKVDITVDNGVLTVSGSREESREEKSKHYFKREISTGSFAQSVTLPEEVDDANATAEYENGILKVVLPKKGEANKIKVQIK